MVDTAVLVATARSDGGGPAALLAWEDTTLLGRLLDQFEDLGASQVHVLARADCAAAVEAALGGRAATVHASPDLAGDFAAVARIAASGEGGLAVASADVLTQREALAGLLADPRIPTGVLSSGGKTGRPFGFRLRNRRGRVVSAASPYHAVRHPNGTFLGVVKVAPADRARLGEVAERLSALTAAELPDGWSAALAAKVERWRMVLERRARARALGLAEPEEEGAEGEDDAEPDVVAGPAPELDAADEAEIERRLAAAREDVPALLFCGLVRAGTQVGESRVRTLFWARPLSAGGLERAAERIVGHDEDAALLANAVKANDGFFTTHFVSPYSKYIARWGAHHGWTPNGVTTLSVAIGFLSAAAFATGERWGYVAGAVLLQLAFTFDCVDGQLARYTRTFTKFGAWLDSIFDRTKEYAVFAGLAIGSAAAGEDVWMLAGAALALQVVRHSIDFSYPAAQHQVLGAARQPPLEQPEDWTRTEAAPRPAPAAAPSPPPVQRRGSSWRALLRRADRSSRAIWVKKMIAFPIGERFAAISISAALFTPRITFLVLLSWGGFAFAYSAAGRVLRSVGRRGSVLAADASTLGTLEAFRDDGPLARALGRVLGPVLPATAAALTLAATAVLAPAVAVTGDGASWPLVAAVAGLVVLLAGAAAGRPLRDRLRWVVPPGLRFAEYAGLLWVAATAGADTVPAAFALLCVVTYRHYDLVYRLRHRGVLPPRWLNLTAGGWEGRLLVGAAVAAAGLTPAAFYVAAAVLGVLFVTETVFAWRSFGRTQRPAVYEDEEEDAE